MAGGIFMIVLAPEGLLQGEGVCQLSQLPPVLEEARVCQVSQVSNSLRNSL